MAFDPRSGDPLDLNGFVRRVKAKAARDSRIRALWLEGSLGRGHGDRYSDVDLHALLSAEDLPGFREDAQAWMNDVEPQVMFNTLFGGNMVNGMSARGLRWDLWPHAGDNFEIHEERVVVLYAQAGVLRPAPTPPAAPTAAQLTGLLREFWRCISLLPAVLGRGERIVAMQGLMVEVGLVSELLLLAHGQVRDRGVKHLNTYLPPEDRARLEQAMLPASLNLQDLADAHLHLATWVSREGPGWSPRLGATYPNELERVVVKVVREELTLLGLRTSL